MFVLVNLERISRGVPPLVGLSPYLGPPAETAARDAEDPTFQRVYGRVQVWYPPSGGMYAFGGAWSGNQVNALAAMFGWMYDDGWGGKGATAQYCLQRSRARPAVGGTATSSLASTRERRAPIA